MHALASIARALDHGDLALARIATLHLRLPDPPPLAKTFPSLEEAARLAMSLDWCGILKGDEDWDPAKHPRTGQPPNPGWFALVPSEPKLPAPGWPSQKVNKAIRAFVRRVAAEIAAKAPLVAARIVGIALSDGLSAALEVFSIGDLNSGEERLMAQATAYFDPPKTLQELQSNSHPGNPGYEQHHIVEQNDANREKFGDAAIDDPSNIVWIPRLKHEEITGEYNRRPDKGAPSVREKLSEEDFGRQREEGLRILREKGVLK